MKKGNEIKCETMGGGKHIYKHVGGREIDTGTTELDGIIAYALEPLKMFLGREGHTTSGDAVEIVIIAEALFEQAEEKIYDAIEFIEDNYGHIEIEVAGPNQEPLVASETKLGVIFTPAKN